MKIKKAHIFIYFLVLISVIAMLVATSYAYYVKVKKSEEKVNVEVKNFDMLLTFENGSQINGHSLIPGWTDSVEFTVANYSKDTIGKYKIVLEVITPLSNMVDEDFVYEIVGESDSKDTTNKVVNKGSTPVPVATKDLGSGVITPNTTHTYKIVYKIKDTADSRKYGKESLFASKIKIVNDDN